jgi:L-gulonolactone oxidase
MVFGDEDVVRAVEESLLVNRRLRAVGSGHSFSGVAVPDEVLVDVSALSTVGRVEPNDDGTGSVEVGAGVPLSVLNEELHRQGWALPNLGDIAYQTVVGAVSTGTHGTGVKHGGISRQVEAITLVDGMGEVRRIMEGDDLRCAQVSLGALGIVTSLRLRVVKAFVLEAVESTARLDDVLESLDAHVASNDHFEFYWVPHTKKVLTKHNNRIDGQPRPLHAVRHWYAKSFMENTVFGAVCRIGRRVPAVVPRVAPLLASSGTRRSSDWSHRIFVSERRVRFVEMEYAIPIEFCAEALRRVDRMITDRGMRIGFPVEVRFAAADDIVLSTAHGRASAYIAVHMFRGVDHREYFRGVEAIMRDYGGRPHWGKMHERTAENLAPAFPEWELFARTRRGFDPQGIFFNEHLVSVLGDG